MTITITLNVNGRNETEEDIHSVCNNDDGINFDILPPAQKKARLDDCQMTTSHCWMIHRYKIHQSRYHHCNMFIDRL
jgi:hypothetical protein